MPVDNISILLDDIPNLDYRLVSVIRQLSSAVSMLLHVAETNKKNIDAKIIPDATQLKTELEATGGSPLNVEALRGKLGESQTANAPTLSSLPPLTDIQYDDGTLVAVAGAVYRRNRTTEPGSWDAVTSSGISNSAGGNVILKTGVAPNLVGSQASDDGVIIDLAHLLQTDSFNLVVILNPLHLPLVDPGISGALWNNGGVINVSP